MGRTGVLLALMFLTASASAAQDTPPGAPEPVLKGFFIGADGGGAVLRSDYVTGGRSVGGGGYGLRFGWGLSRSFTIAMDVLATKLAVADSADYLMGHGDMLLRYHPLRWRRGKVTWVPFVHAGGGFRDISAEGASPTASRIYEFSGGTVTVGAGTYVFLAPGASLFIASYHTRGDFDDERIGNVTTNSRNKPGQSSRLAIGVNWHFGDRDR